MQDNRTGEDNSYYREDGEVYYNVNSVIDNIIAIRRTACLCTFILLSMRVQCRREKTREGLLSNTITYHGIVVTTVEDLRVPVMHMYIIHIHTRTQHVYACIYECLLRRYCPAIDSPRYPGPCILCI